MPSQTVRRLMAQVWPELKFIILSDPQWQAPTQGEVLAALDAYAPRRRHYRQGVYECEEFAIDFMAFCRRINAQNADHNWPLGVVCGTRFKSEYMDHWANVCVSDDGLWLIEPQTGGVWAAKPVQDQVYFAMM
jgi:hypothetical protein